MQSKSNERSPRGSSRTRIVKAVLTLCVILGLSIGVYLTVLQSSRPTSDPDRMDALQLSAHLLHLAQHCESDFNETTYRQLQECVTLFDQKFANKKQRDFRQINSNIDEVLKINERIDALFDKRIEEAHELVRNMRRFSPKDKNLDADIADWKARYSWMKEYKPAAGNAVREIAVLEDEIARDCKERSMCS